ncbi:MAG TPA: aminotransferase class III-fold pyridoxal phosphate-dependent enzyme [Ilumatobacteraceae bacterium]
MQPIVDTEFATAALADHWGLAGEISAVHGELDKNFKVVTSDGRQLLLKVHAPADDGAEIDLQLAVLQHLATHAAALAVQRPIADLDGDLLPIIHGQRVRLTTWLPGDVWVDAISSDRDVRAATSASLGRLLAHLDQVLAGFRHPASRRVHRWDLAVAADHRGLTELIDDETKRAAVDSVLRHFAEEVAPRMRDQPRQVIHNDANDRNVLVGADGSVSGLIDFGDMVETWRVNELAIACAYAMLGARDPIGAVLPLVAAYHDEAPLTETEAEVLFDLIATRLAVSICMAAKQIRDDPANEYLLISQTDVWAQLQGLLTENRAIAVMRVRAACRFEAVPSRPGVERWLAHNGHTFGPVLRRDLCADRLVVLDITPAAIGTDAGSLDALYSDEQLADVVPIGRYGEDRAVYQTAAFETSDPGERRTIHIGIDLFAPAGTEVLAPLPGVVHEIGCDLVPLGFGGILVLAHETADGTPFWTLCGHLSSASLERLTVGQRVSTGDSLAVLGRPDENGGWPPHLHFQVMTDLCGWSANEIIGVVARSQWDVWSSVFPNPNLVLGLPVDCTTLVARDPSWLQRERRYVLGRSLSLAYADPLKIVRGEGIHLIDARGERYLDMVNNVCHVGHCHPRVVAAGQRQMALLNTNSRYLHDNLVEYSRRLTATLPAELSVVFMVNSGSEANDLALRLARAYTGQRDAITVDHVYHGNLTSIVDVSPYKFAGPGGTGRPEHVWVAEMPDLYRGRLRGGDAHAGTGYAASVAQQIETMTAAGRQPAVFFSEGILGTGGMLTLPGGYLAAAYAHVRAAGGVCVADEVQLGFGRVGSHMWAFETQGVVPDIVTMGKPIGNGHPMAAVVTRPEIAAAFANGMEYFSTFGGNPVSAAIGLAVLDVIRDEHLMHNALVAGSRLMDGVRALAARHPLIGDVRGHGLFIGVELVRDHVTLEPAAAELTFIVESMKARRILLSTEGPHHNVLKIKPPIVFSEANCDEFLAAFDQVLAEAEAIARAAL